MKEVEGGLMIGGPHLLRLCAPHASESRMQYARDYEKENSQHTPTECACLVAKARANSQIQTFLLEQSLFPSFGRDANARIFFVPKTPNPMLITKMRWLLKSSLQLGG